MIFEHGDTAKAWQRRVRDFMDQHVYPAEARFHADLATGNPWALSPVVEETKAKAKAAGLWNLFMPPNHGHAHVDDRFEFEGPGLSNLEYAPLAEMAGNKVAQAEIAMIKVAAPRIALKVIDDAIQAHGGGGVSEDFGLAELWANNRMLRIADGPDEVHNRSIARIEFGKYRD